jgi:hypothetical protein
MLDIAQAKLLMKTELVIHAGALMQEQFHDGMIRNQNDHARVTQNKCIIGIPFNISFLLINLLNVVINVLHGELR